MPPDQGDANLGVDVMRGLDRLYKAIERVLV
jgi:hypothetical protein